MNWLALLSVTLGLSLALPAADASAAKRLPKPERDLDDSAKPGETRTAIFAGGCFWCLEAVFESLKGVTNVVSGFAGGTADTAVYETVSAGGTKHAESVQVTYEPAAISYGTLLRVFFTLHDPTQRDRQGPDVGRQYRSAIFYATDQQKEVAQEYIRQLMRAQAFTSPIMTGLEPLDRFYPAEAYHQDFVRRHPDHPYVQRWALPKLDKLRHLYPELVKAKRQ